MQPDALRADLQCVSVNDTGSPCQDLCLTAARGNDCKDETQHAHDVGYSSIQVYDRLHIESSLQVCALHVRVVARFS